jgi:hypothetical protein
MRGLAGFVTLCFLALPAIAQEEYPKAEIFGGYQYLRLNPINLNGWNAAVTGNFNRWLGVTGDFSGMYKSGASLHTYMFGPQFSARTAHVTPFAHALFGGATVEGTSAFSMALGGGLDVNAGRHLAIRLVQADWMYFRSGGEAVGKNVRVSAGLVFRF